MASQTPSAVVLLRLTVKALDCVLRKRLDRVDRELLRPPEAVRALRGLREQLRAAIMRCSCQRADAATLNAAEELLSILVEVKAVLASQVAERKKRSFLPEVETAPSLAGSLRDLSRTVRDMAAPLNDQARARMEKVGVAIAQQADELLPMLERKLHLQLRGPFPPPGSALGRFARVRVVVRRLITCGKWPELEIVTSGAFSFSGDIGQDVSSLERLLGEASLFGEAAQLEPPVQPAQAAHPLDDAICGICLDVLRVPVMLCTNSGRSYCKACADKLLQFAKERGKAATDPVSRERIPAERPYVPNRSLEALIGELRNMGFVSGSEDEVSTSGAPQCGGQAAAAGVGAAAVRAKDVGEAPGGVGGMSLGVRGSREKRRR